MSKRKKLLVPLKTLADSGITDQQMREVIEKTLIELNRKPKVPCVCDECGGRITKQVSSLFHGRYTFSPAKCECCGVVYWGADKFDAVEIGVEAFERAMRQPFTI